MAVETCVNVKSSTLHRLVCHNLPELRLRVCVRIHTHVQKSGLLIKILNENRLEGYVFRVLDDNLWLFVLLPTEWIPNFSSLANEKRLVLAHVDDIIILNDCLGHSHNLYEFGSLVLVLSGKTEGFLTLDAQSIRGIVSSWRHFWIHFNISYLEHSCFVEVLEFG